MPDRDEPLIRRRLVCRGTVQGVGFRPAVWRLGRALGLAGTVRNDAEGATIEVQGAAAAVTAFEARLPRDLPPLARLASVEATSVVPVAAAGAFEVVATKSGRRGESLVPPDVALCAACREEFATGTDRRHRHAFVTCTDCGPRFSLVRTLPYDRERTAMACFPLCAECAREYADPASRRFHAEPICCPRCGPRLSFLTAGGDRRRGDDEALAAARSLLAAGGIVAIKGVGGFQLACRADDATAVQRLRQRKRRPQKPLAIMVRDLAAARRHVRLGAEDEALLAGAIGPIVLAPRCVGAPVAASVAPGIDDLGVMLPTTGLHLGLFRDASYAALVMTSGNRSDEPICIGNRQALHDLAGLADAFLLHDRDIVRRVDDSVVRATASGPVLVRRSRGYAPEPVPLPVATPTPILAVGGHLQTTAAVGLAGQAFVSQHVGDLDSERARAFLREVALGLEQFLEVEGGIVACDTHPDYPSAAWARELAVARGARLLPVPHHLAHAAAVLGEHAAVPARRERAVALLLDGTGHGADTAAWGAELLRIDGILGWSRLAFGEALPLVGGEAAVREPWRIVVAVLAAGGLAARLSELPVAATVEPGRLDAVRALGGHPWPLAHGAGRLFESVGALLGLGGVNDYEGEAAARLEALAANHADDGAPAWPEVALSATCDVPHRHLLLAAAARCLDGEPPARIAFGLHRSYAALWVQSVQRRLPGLRSLAIGGGCLVNRLLRQELVDGFRTIGCTPFLPRVLPPGDGGLAYGQCVVAAVAAARTCTPQFVSRPEEP